MHEIFALDAATYGVAIVLIAFIRYNPDKIRSIDTGRVWTRLRLGMNYLRERKPILWFGIASYMVFVVLIVHGFYLLNIYVDEYLQEGGGVIALADIVYAVGAIIAGFFIRKIFRKTSVVTAILTLMCITILITLVVGSTRELVILLGFQLLMGICNAGIRVMRVTWLFTVIPNDVMGRSTSVFNSVRIILQTALISLFSLAFFTEADGVPYAYILCSMFIVLAVVPILFQRKQLLELEQKAD
ncbi:MAG: MFS transporter [Flavobacteriales bacterium]|nr:MFS transporter [Flavobacteriales bacterium]